MKVIPRSGIPVMIDNVLISQAMEAASEVAGSIGVKQVEQVLLHHSQHITVLWPAVDTVARIVVSTDDVTERLSRELAVARYLTEKGAPVGPPSAVLPAGPHFRDKFGMTLWQFVPHTPADEDNPAHVAAATAALCRIHRMLADYPGRLPSFGTKIDECRLLLGRRSSLPSLDDADREFLLTVYGRITRAMDSLPIELVPIHGDAGLHNVLIAAGSACYIDFEDASLGPREWDIGWLSDPDLALFEPIHRGRLAVLSDLRSLCVSVWCFARYDLPEKREAADYHLAYLRQRFG
jgi:hypothetical protein